MLAIVGDTQRTSIFELLWRHHDAEQVALFDDLCRLRPDGVVNLGDLVTWGSSRKAWRHFDRLHRRLWAAGVPLIPVLGNHDYMLSRRSVRRQVGSRFPHLAGRSWFTFRWAGLAFVALDSNFRALGAQDTETQNRWYLETLAGLEADPAVGGIIGIWHHPPFTNSRIVRPSVGAERYFVRPLLETSKAMAVFCGHCHGYERFEQGGIPFIVSGGGGGPLQLVEHRPARRRFADRFEWRWPLRFLNYCRVRVHDERARLEVIRIVDPALSTEVVDEVDLVVRSAAAATG